FGFAPAQSGTVSRCVENSNRGPLMVPGSSTSKLPVSVGRGIRLFTVSKRIAEAGTPTACSSSDTAFAIAASWPVTPSTAKNFIRCASAAFTSNRSELLLMLSLPFCIQRRVMRHAERVLRFLSANSITASRVISARFPQTDRSHHEQRAGDLALLVHAPL